MLQAAAKVPILFIAVPHLPRDAQVEWQILFGRRLVYSHMGEEDGDIDQITSGEAQAEILHGRSLPKTSECGLELTNLITQLLRTPGNAELGAGDEEHSVVLRLNAD